MDEKQLATRLRDIANNAANADVELRLLADELSPPKPKPEPGTVVWYWLENDGPYLGIVEEPGADYARTQWGGIVDLDEEGWKPARILGPRQVAVDVPPVRWEWPYWANQIVAAYRNSDTGRNSIMADMITREEAERMEASNE